MHESIIKLNGYDFINMQINTGSRFSIKIDNMTSGIVDYNITLPESKLDHYLILWGENEQGHVLCPYMEIYIIVSQAPELNVTNTLNDNYYGHAFIEVDVSVYDDTDGYVYYRIDEGKEVKISGLIQSFFEIEQRILQIEITEGSLVEGKHTLYVYFKDEFGSDSVPFVKEFDYSHEYHTPELIVGHKLKGYTYGYFETININCKVTTRNSDDQVKILLKYNFGDYEIIHEFPQSLRNLLSDEESMDFSYKIPMIPYNGFHTVTIKAINKYGIESKFTLLDFEVRRLPGIEFIKPFKVNYNNDEVIEVIGMVVDYDINTQFDVYYKLDNSGNTFVKTVSIGTNYKSNEFKFALNPSTDVNIHNFKLWIENNHNEIYSTTGNFLVNSPPQLELINPLRNVYYDNDHMNIDFKIKDNTNVKLCYSFDSNQETCFKETIYSYEREYSYRKQITIDRSVVSYDRHTIHIFAVDEFKMKSTSFDHIFTYQT